MKVIINGVTYDSTTWEDSDFTMETDMTLAQIEAASIPGTNTNIIVEEDKQEHDGQQRVGTRRILVGCFMILKPIVHY